MTTEPENNIRPIDLVTASLAVFSEGVAAIAARPLSGGSMPINPYMSIRDSQTDDGMENSKYEAFDAGVRAATSFGSYLMVGMLRESLIALDKGETGVAVEGAPDDDTPQQLAKRIRDMLKAGTPQMDSIREHYPDLAVVIDRKPMDADDFRIDGIDQDYKSLPL